MSIELNFIDSNSKNHILSINDILLSKNNPRFSILKNINIDLCQFILEDTYETNQYEIFNELIINEANLENLRNLIESIEVNGFKNQRDNILVVYNQKINKYIIAEGNRRIAILKILTNQKSFPDFDFFKTYYMALKGILDSNKLELDNEFKTLKNNYNAILTSINKIKSTFNHFDVYYKVLTNDDELWSLIFDKHITTGKRPGMREWNKSKYFADILSLFPDGIYKNNINNLQIFQKINRDKNVVINDFKEAQFVYSCFYMQHTTQNQVLDFNDEYVLEFLKQAPRISSLEKKHSYEKIRTLFINHCLNKNERIFDQEYYEIKFNEENYRIEFNEHKFKTKSLLSKLYQWWNWSFITTRDIKDENKPTIINDLNFMINGVDIYSDKLDKNILWNLDENQLSTENLECIIGNNEDFYKHNSSVLTRFKLKLQINKNNEKMILFVSKNKIFDSINNAENPLVVFPILYNQLIHNIQNNYYNAIFISIRSFLETLIMFGTYLLLLESNKLEDITTKTTIIKVMIGETKEVAFRHKLCKNYYYNEPNSKNSYLKNRTDFVNNIISKECDEKIKNIIKEKLNNLVWDEQKWRHLSDPIHNCHKIYASLAYERMFQNYIDYQDLLYLLLENIDWTRFNLISNVIKNQLKNDN